MCISARDERLSWPMQMSSWLAAEPPRSCLYCHDSHRFKTSLSPRRAMHCRPQEKMASETHSSSSCHLIGCSLWVFNRIKEGFGGNHCIVTVLHLLMPVYERLDNKSALIFPAMHRYHQSTVFTEYSIYWRAIDHWWRNRVGQCWKLVVNRWHKMTFNQVISLTNWQLVCKRTRFLKGRRKLPDVIYFLLPSLVLSDAALDCHQ